jgi:CSLREA domain-containing protein
MRQTRQIPTRLFKPVQLTLSAILTVLAFLAIASPARAGNTWVFFGPVSEFFGPAREPDAAAPLVKTGARENIFLAAGGGFSPFTLAAPTYSTVGATITENFNGMGSSGTAALPADWRFGSTSAYSAGVTAAQLAAGTSGGGILSGTSGGGYYNFASGVTATAPDRAPGWLTSSTFTSPRQLFVKLTNNTGATIGSADIAYDIEKYRSGTRAFTINFFTSTDGTTWTAQTGGDQSYNANGTNNVINPPTTINKSVTVSGLSLANGADLYLRWSYTGSGGSTNAQALGIDNFSFTPIAASPGTLQFAVSDSNVDENLLTGNVPVSRAGGSLGAVSVDYAVTGGTATNGAACTAGVDYVLSPSPGTLNWADLDAADKLVPIQLCTDLLTYEGPETIELTLSNVQGGAAPGGQVTHTLTINDLGARFFNSDPISITGGPASPYPSDITVAGMPGTITAVKVTLQNVTHTFPDDIDVLLVGPAGQAFLLMSDIGGDPNITNRVYTFSDSAANFMQDASNNSSGTYKPTNYDAVQQDDNFDAPAPAPPYLSPGPTGTDTLTSVFEGTGPNGTWSLYVRDAFAGGDNGVINAGWNLELKTMPPTPGTVRFLPAVFTSGEGTTATITAKRVGGSLGAATVDYAASNGSATGGAACGAGVDYVNTAGTLSWADGDSGTKSFTVQLCADTELAESTETVSLTLANPTGVTTSGTNPAALNIINSETGGAVFGNHNAITIPESGSSTPYPSTITVAGVGASVTDMRLSLNGLNHAYTSDIVMLLVGPMGQQYVFFGGIGNDTVSTNIDLKLYDGAADLMSSGPLASGSYQPTNLGVASFPFPPAPQGPYFQAAPAGSDTFTSTFGGTDPNGVWSLYIFDQFNPDSGSVAGGWDLDIQTIPPGPGTVEFSAPGFNSIEGAMTPITVKRAGGSAGAISVDYATGGGTAAGGAACGAGVDYVSASGTLSWAGGDTADKSFNVQLCADAPGGESSETVDLTLLNPAGTAISGTNPATLNIADDTFGSGSSFSNTGAIVIPGSGTATPYPSDITVSGQSGTISNMRVTLKDLSHTFPGDIDMLLVGPEGQAFYIMSDAGQGLPITDVDIALSDGAPTLMPGNGQIVSGPYKPTNNSPGDSMPSPAPVVTNDPAPVGIATFASVFGSTDPNGTWSLYAFDHAGGDQGVVAGGWMLEIQTTAPGPGTVEFSTAAYTGFEGTTATVTAKRVGGGLGAISVDYAATDGSATGGAACGAGVDYVNTSGTLNWADSDSTTKSFTMQICTDSLFAESTETVNLALSNPVGTSITGPNPALLSIENNSFDASTFSNSDSISIPDGGPATPYPSTILVSGMPGVITEVRVVLKNFSHTYTSDVDVLLVGPQGQTFVVMSDVAGDTPSNDVTLSLYDSAAANMTGAALATGPYKPTDILTSNDAWPAPAPAGPYNSPAPFGSGSFAGVFNGTDPNGTWSLYVFDQISPDGGDFAGGWELQIDSAPTVHFSAAAFSATETDATATIPVIRSGTTGPLTVDYATSNGTATGGASCSAGVDYISTSGTLSFADGEENQSFNVTLCNDAVFDGLKIVNLTLSNPSVGTDIGTPHPAVLNINDDEPGPAISISGVTVNENAGTASFEVTQSFVTIAETTFRYTTADGTAINTADYTPVTSSPASIAAGNTTTTVTVPILQDGGFEPSETFMVTIHNAINADILTATATGTITDDDIPASYIVNSNNDVDDTACDATHCSLREAINAANAVGGIITFAPSVTGTITLTSPLPVIFNNMNIEGPGANTLTIDAANNGTVIDIPIFAPTVSMTVSGLTITGARNTDQTWGGAVTNHGTFTLLNSVLTGNSGAEAGGIMTHGAVVVRNSSLVNNTGGRPPDVPCANTAGAISVSSNVPLDITNTTISGNTATGCGYNNGGIMMFDGRLHLTSSTVTNNNSTGSFSGAVAGGSVTPARIRSSIIAGNSANRPDVSGSFISEGFNLIGRRGSVTAFNKPTDQTGTNASPVNPGLGALANNGGTTPTHAVLTGSRALDKGNSFGLAADQRGTARPFDDPDTANAPGGDASDIGAYEATVAYLTVTGGPLSFADTLAGTFSAEQTYTVSGANLSGDVTITAPSDFQFSVTSGSGFGTSAVLSPSSGTLNTTTIYVRFAPASAGPKGGNITNESPGALAKTVAVNGSGVLAGTLQFTHAAFSDSETNADHTYNVTVSRTGGAFGAVSVDYAVTDGSAAAADNDYSISPSTGMLSWADGDTADKAIVITIKGDLTNEPDETINLALANAAGGAALGSPAASVLTITNDDPVPLISVDDVSFTGADSVVAQGFAVTLSNPGSQTVTVHYETANDTAIAGEDYTAASGTLTFNPGETSQNVPVTILPDTVNEATEQFFLNLDIPVNATIADNQGIGTIPNDDPDVSFSIDDVTHTEGNSGTVSYTFTITKTGNTAQTTSVDWSTVNGSATAANDFAGVPATTLNFLPADTAKQVTVLVNGDISFESDETFIVRLSNPVNAFLTDGDGLGTIQNDDAAQIFLVNVNSDTDDGICDAANCSLREAINAVNIAGGQIDFAPNVNGSIGLLSALPPLASSNATVINGPGAGVLAVKRDTSAGALRIFDIQGSGVFTISGLAINDGDVRPIGGAFNNLGGAIRIMAGHGVTINSCTFTNNWANNGAAIYNGANPATSPLTVNNSTFTANNANQSGGGIENRFSNRLTVNGSTFDANGANNFGGGIHNIASGVVFVNDSTFTGNVANTGAAINNDDTGSLTITRSIISGNHAVVGGGISNKNGGLDVHNSTISGNDASEGGGAYNHVATMNFYNSTISGNTATSIGGGIYYTFQGQSNGTIQNSTITKNHAPNGGGVMVFNGSSVVRAGNTILAANTGSQGPDLYGTIYSSGYNILGTTGGSYANFVATTGDQVGQFSVINPLLAPLADNGGRTRTHLPLTGSPAIDSGNAFGETADQRGFTRTVNGTTDIGAVEVQAAPTQISAFAGSPQSVTEGTVFVPLEARVLDAGNAPVGGVTVTFTAPSSGASGMFANGTMQTTAITDANGVAASSVLTANNTAGSFGVTAAFAASPTASFNLTILELPRSISVNDVTFTGADSLLESGFTVTLSAPSSQIITVHYQTADGTAIAGEDYTAASGTLTFNPGETSQNVPVAILPDTVNELTEQFFVNLDTPVNATISDAQGVGTIPNDDPEVSFSIDDVTLAEGDTGTTAFTFTITKNGSTSRTTSVNWATANGTAIAPGDYAAVSSTPVTFLPGDTSKQVTVLVNGDGNYEQNETFTVGLSLPVNAAILDGSGMGVIVNDDAIPSFTIDDVTHNEGSAGTTSYTFTVTKSGATELDSSVQFETQDGSATLAGNDYQSNTGTLNFLAADTSKQVTVLVNGDFFIEPDEVFTLHLADPVMAAISDADGTGTIINDDLTPAITYVDDDWSVLSPGTDPDGAGPANAIGYDAFDTIQEGIDAVAASGQVSVYAGTYDEDLNANNAGVRIIGAGAGSTNIRGPQGGPGTTVAITASNVTLAGFTITRLGNNTTDWNAPDLNSAGVAIQGQAVTGALIRDNIITGNRTGIDINNSSGHTVRNNVIDFNRTGLIFRNQTDNMVMTENFVTNNWTVGVVFLDASGGTNSPQQTAWRGAFSNNNISANWYGQIVDRQAGGSLPAPGTTNTKNFRGNWFGTTSPVVTTANSAEPGYAAQIPVAFGGTATPPGGQPDIAGPASANFRYHPILESGTDTNVETTPGRGAFGFQGVAPANVTVWPIDMAGWYFVSGSVGASQAGFEIGPGTPPLGTGSLFFTVDAQGSAGIATTGYEGTPLAQIGALSYSTYQDNNASSFAPTLQFDIDFDLGDGYLFDQGRLVFVPPAASVQQNVWQSWDPMAGQWYGNSAAVVAGDTGMLQPCPQASPCTWNQLIAQYPNIGIRGESGQVVLGAGGNWAPGFEGNVDKFVMSIGGSASTFDYEPLPALSIDDVTRAEGSAGTTDYTFTVSLSRPIDEAVTVNYATADGTAAAPGDYAAISSTSLVFAPFETSKQVTVQVNGDTAYEAAETFTVELSGAVNALVSDASGLGTITNDDTQPTFSIDDVTHAEGNTGTTDYTFTVSLSAASGLPASIEYNTANGTATAASGDYQAVSATALNFAIGETSKTLTINVNGDTTYEADESFTVHIGNASGATILDSDGAAVITNDDAAPGLSIGDFTFTGADSGVVTGFAVTLSGAAELPVTVHYQTANDTAIAGQDYTATSGTLTFNPGGPAVRIIPVNILPDTTQEATEQFFMNLDTPVNATIADGQGIGTIPNDDAPPAFAVDDVTQGEGSGGTTTFTFTVTRTGSTALGSTVDFAAQAGSAAAGAACGPGVDYITAGGTLNFAAADTAKPVTVTVCGDTAVEPDETFTVHLSNAGNGSITDADGLGTIQNDTTPAVQFASAVYLEDESQTAVITLVRTGDTSGQSTVSFATSDGTAHGGACSTVGMDYAPASGTVTFDPTETTRSFNVPLCVDGLFETTFETVNLTLSAPAGPTVLGDQSTAILNVNDTASTYKSTTPIMIGDGATANPYPATINVTGAPSVTGTMRITLFDLTHARPEDLDILLVAPNGQAMVLMADSGGMNALTGNGVTLTFDDAAGTVLPDSLPLTTRKYEPTTWISPVAPFIAPAPAGPYAEPGHTLGGAINLNSVFGPVHPNGAWQLFIRDQGGVPPLGGGQIAAGWGLQFLAPTSAEASLSGRVTTANGSGIRNAIVKLMGGRLTEPRYVATGSFGTYAFDGLAAGETYVIQVSAKRFRFAQPSRIFTLQDNVTDMDFTANPQE